VWLTEDQGFTRSPAPAPVGVAAVAHPEIDGVWVPRLAGTDGGIWDWQEGDWLRVAGTRDGSPLTTLAPEGTLAAGRESRRAAVSPAIWAGVILPAFRAL
jgi:hypothetical protein